VREYCCKPLHCQRETTVLSLLPPYMSRTLPAISR
jgi:hypothetical protein